MKVTVKRNIKTKQHVILARYLCQLKNQSQSSAGLKHGNWPGRDVKDIAFTDPDFLLDVIRKMEGESERDCSRLNSIPQKVCSSPNPGYLRI